MTPETLAAIAKLEGEYDEELALTLAHVFGLPDSVDRDAQMLTLNDGYRERLVRDLKYKPREGRMTASQAVQAWTAMIVGLREMREPPPRREKATQRASLPELEKMRRRLAERNEPHGYDALAREAMVARSTVQARYKDAQRPPGDPIPGVCDLKGSTHH